jgi:branched-chain amino acid transport system ATP-binding protein
MIDAILEVKAIHTFIGQFHILEGVSVTVPRGSITVLLGRNGAGKTTTLRSVMGLNPPSEGDVLLNGQSLLRQRSFDVARAGVGYVPEHRAIFGTLTVRENLELAQHQRGELDAKADFIFDLFPDLKRLYKLSGKNLSGGQQQMLSIARALVPNNQLLLIDEPSEGLAPVIIEALMEAIRRLSETTTVLLVEQNFVVASKLADYYVIIDEGRSVRAGAMAALAADRDLVRLYLGVA